MERCKYELFVEKYFGLSTTVKEDTKLKDIDFGEAVDLVCAADQEFKKEMLPEIEFFGWVKSKIKYFKSISLTEFGEGQLSAYESVKEQMEWLKAAPQPSTVLGWVDVAEKFPEVGQMVDTWNGVANRRAIFEKPDLFIRHVEPFSNERIYVTHFPDITHWMPLPEPPNISNSITYPNILLKKC